MELTLYCCVLSLVLIQQHQAYPRSKPEGPTTEQGPAAEEEGPAADEDGPAAEERGVPASRRRVKRCSCENPRDKECVYFCHVGILWVNTPSQVVSYGSVRLRRELGRCLCDDRHDDGCLRYCSADRTRSDGKPSGAKRQTSKPQERRTALWEKTNRTESGQSRDPTASSGKENAR